MEGTVTAIYLQYGVIGATVIGLAFISYRLWLAVQAANVKAVELTERVTACMERMADAIDGLNKAQAESTRMLTERIDLGGQVQRMAADILVMKGKP